METTRLSTKGQVILPKKLRTSRSWLPGTEFIVEETKEGILLRPAKLFPATTLEQVVGCLKYKGKKVTLSQMDAGITKQVRRRHESGRY